MKFVLSIDPGDKESAYVLARWDDRHPLAVGKIGNDQLKRRIREFKRRSMLDHIVVEMIASYGMPVGREVFETCLWIGRYLELADTDGLPATLVYRRDVKLHLCHDSRAKDGNVAHALVDRFAPGERNMGKGTKDDPGWFRGFAGDIWQAYAAGVTYIDKLEGYQP